NSTKKRIIMASLKEAKISSIVEIATNLSRKDESLIRCRLKDFSEKELEALHDSLEKLDGAMMQFEQGRLIYYLSAKYQMPERELADAFNITIRKVEDYNKYYQLCLEYPAFNEDPDVVDRAENAAEVREVFEGGKWVKK
uniref:HTH_40 domain-containing protein n=1 Tax=Macrostomum lignano TaxID=282301 RepID=A0A1I8GEW2_9PLAT